MNSILFTDVTNCDSIVYETTEPETAMSSAAIIGIVFGAVIFVVLIIVLIFCIRRRHVDKRSASLTKEELDELLQEICKRCRKDEGYCKRGIVFYPK